MICRKCSYILGGSENFCPNCAEPCTQKPQNEKAEDTRPPVPPSILFPAAESKEDTPESQHRIFREEQEMPPSDTKKHRKSRAPALLIVLLITVIVAVGGFTAAEYLGLAPAIMQYLEEGSAVNSDEVEESGTTADVTEFSENHGVVSPDINYRPEICYVATDSSLTVRKGPDNSYAPLEQLESGCQLQVIGGSAVSDMWVYTYVPSLDCYGWVASSFLSASDVIEPSSDEKDETKETAVAESTSEAA